MRVVIVPPRPHAVSIFRSGIGQWRELTVMGNDFADLVVAILVLVTALLIGLVSGWREASASPDWRPAPKVHAPSGPVVAR